MRFFGNFSETIVTTNDLTRAFLIQSNLFDHDQEYVEVVPAIVKDPAYQELEFSLCVDLSIPKDVLAIVEIN